MAAIPNGVKTNCHGLIAHGEEVANMLIDAGIWIDLSHSSDKALASLIPKHYERKIPLLVTHGTLRSKLKLERGITTGMLKHFTALGGMFGFPGSFLKKHIMYVDYLQSTN
ncbi:MAG TPA: membrane dipeptidase [Bacteriovoracaceae bacterium]|nr:membrane dipeptidase [Bacteriovoracaceae bacterium]